MKGAGCQIGNERIEPGKSRCTTRREKKGHELPIFQRTRENKRCCHSIKM